MFPHFPKIENQIANEVGIHSITEWISDGGTRTSTYPLSTPQGITTRPVCGLTDCMTTMMVSIGKPIPPGVYLSLKLHLSIYRNPGKRHTLRDKQIGRPRVARASPQHKQPLQDSFREGGPNPACMGLCLPASRSRPSSACSVVCAS